MNHSDRPGRPSRHRVLPTQLYRTRWLRLYVTIALAAALALTTAFSGVALAAPDLGPAPSEVISVPYLTAAPYYEWSAKDRTYLQGLWAGAPADPASPADTPASVALTKRLLTEVGQLQMVIDQLRSREGYLAPKGYAIYRAQSTGKLLALNWAWQARLDLVAYLTGQRTARPGADFYPATDRDGDHVFDLSTRANTWAYPDARKAIDALDYAQADPAAFAGYEGFLLPYAISDSAIGYGTLGHGFVGAHTANAFSAWDAHVMTHEFAHSFGFTFLGFHGAEPGPWDDYVALRGLAGYEGAAEAGEPGWKTSTYEVFAEDFRILMGNPEAAASAPQTAYADPRSVAGLADKIKAFFAKREAAYRPPEPMADLGLGFFGATRVIPRSPIDGREPEVTYAVTDRASLPFFIATDRKDVSYWLSKDGADLQDGWRVTLDYGLYFGELDLSAGPGVYKLVLNADADAGSSFLYRAVYIIYEGTGAVAQAAATTANATQIPLSARLAWTSDSRLLLTGDLAGYRVQFERRTPAGAGYTSIEPRLAGASSLTRTAQPVALDSGDGVYRFYYSPASGQQSWATIVLDRPGDPWSPVLAPAGGSVPATAGAAVLGTHHLNVTGVSSQPKIGLFIYDPSGQQLTYAEARRAADGSFSGGVDLPPAAGDLYLVNVATGQLADSVLTTQWSLAVKVASPTAVAATGQSGLAADPLAASFEAAEKAAVAGDVYLAGSDYLDALRTATDRGERTAEARAVDGLLALTADSRDYLAVDAARQALGGLTPNAAAAAEARAGQSFARAYKRREALQAFTGALADDPANAKAAAGLRLVNDANYTWVEPGAPARAFVTRLKDIDIWAKQVIERMSFKGAVKGFSDGTFRPDQPVRRDEAVAMVDRVLGLESEAKTRAGDPLPYADVATIGDWARGYVSAAYDHGLIDLRETRFRPADSATRAEVAVMLVRGLGAAADQAARSLAGERTTFADDARIPAWSRGYLVYAVRNGILTGYTDHTVRPNDPVQRSEMAALAGRIDDRTTTAIDSLELVGTLVKAEPGEPGGVWVRSAGEAPDSEGTERTLAFNPSFYAAGRSVALTALRPGDRVRLVTGEAGAVVYLEVLAAP
ncbi:MAG: S-layer homology domain-containing protein [Bacillota bacterium]